MVRFVECEKWRKEFGADNLAGNFEYTEKPEVFKYYPQYYHKTDKVRSRPVAPAASILIHVLLGWPTCLH